MSALTERTAHYHRAWSIDSTDTESPGIECRCINSPERMTWTDYAAHVAEVTEAAVRARVAADIRALEYTKEQADEHVRLGGTVGEVDWYDIAIDKAARTAEGTHS